MICPFATETLQTVRNIQYDSYGKPTKVISTSKATPQECRRDDCPFYDDGNSYTDGACRRVEQMLGEE